MPQLPIAGGFYEDKSLPISHQICQNWYPNIVQANGLNQETLYGTPGIKQLATSGSDSSDANRGAWTFNDVPYFVNGSTLYSLDRSFNGSVESFTTTSVGTISGEGRVSMADNGTQLLILAPSGTGYIYDGTTLSTISDSNFTGSGNPQYVVFIDGYFVCTTDTRKWIISNLNDGTIWGALDFATAESDPDSVVAPVVNNNRLFITGTYTVEAFQNVAGAGFPFQRDNTFLDKGCKAAFSLINANRRFFMVGGGRKETPAIWMFDKNDFTKISTTAIDDVLAGYTDTEISNCFGYSYAQSGAYFVGFTFPSAVFVFDMVSGRWHERTSYYNNTRSRWRINSMVDAYGRILVGDAIDGRIGELDLDTYSDYGNDIHRVVATQPFSNEGNEILAPCIELTMESGVGNSTVTDPKIAMATSKDNRTWSMDRVRPIGAIGEYNKRVVWRRNGRFSRYTTLRFTLTDQVKPVIIKLELK